MKTLSLPILVVIVLLLFWQFLSFFDIISKTLLASPQEVATAFVNSFSTASPLSEKIHIHAWKTIARALEGWALAGILGIVFGLAIGSVRRAYDAGEVLSEFVRSIPPILFFPLLLVAFNYEAGAYVWTIFIGCFPIMFLTVAKGVQNISQKRLDFLKVSGVNRRTIMFARGVEVLPSVLLGLRLTLATALTIAVVTEMVFTPRDGLSLGALARDAEIDFNTPVFYAATITIGIFGYFSNLLLRRFEHWFGEDSAPTQRR
jgi:sulfonate transport system permease protein